MTELFKVSQSKVNTWRKCQRAYQYQYEENLQKRALPRPLKFGRIIHQVVEADAQGEDTDEVIDKIAQDNRQLFLEEREMYGDIVNDARYIMDAYFEFWRDDPLVYLRHDKRLAEHPFEIEIDKDIICKGTIDGVVRAKKMNWLAEHKSHKSFPNVDHRWRNLQSAVYIRICEMLDWWKLEGTLWDYIRSKAPTRPQVLKDGSLSTRIIDTLPQVIVDVCKENKIKPPKNLVDETHHRMHEWFERVFTPVKKNVVSSLFADFIVTARQMADTPRPARGRPMSVGKHCDWCQFEDLCRAELQGSDVDFIKEHHYVQGNYEEEAVNGKDDD